MSALFKLRQFRDEAPVCHVPQCASPGMVGGHNLCAIRSETEATSVVVLLIADRRRFRVVGRGRWEGQRGRRILGVREIGREGLDDFDDSCELGFAEVWERRHRGIWEADLDDVLEVGIRGQFARSGRPDLVFSLGEVTRLRTQKTGGNSLSIALVAMALRAVFVVENLAILCLADDRQ